MASVTANDMASCRREEARTPIARPSTIRTPDALPLDVTVDDLSQAGFSFRGTDIIPIGALIHIGLSGAGRARARVAWHRGDRHGCRFHPPLTPQQVTAAFSQPSDAAITWLAPASEPKPKTTLPLVVRLGVIIGIGVIGWSMLALGLRNLPSF